MVWTNICNNFECFQQRSKAVSVLESAVFIACMASFACLTASASNSARPLRNFEQTIEIDAIFMVLNKI